MSRRRGKGPEALTQDLILDWLQAEQILAYRMNTGAMVVPETGTTRRRFIAYGVAGMADILCFPDLCKRCRIRRRDRKGGCGVCDLRPKVLWIEMKSATGRQKPEQRSFEMQVTAEGHGYLLARSLDDVLLYLGE
jgi:hypothetical protein